MMNKKIVAAVTAIAMAVTVFIIAGGNSSRVLAGDNGRNVAASAVTEESIASAVSKPTVDTPDEGTVTINDNRVAMADSIDSAESTDSGQSTYTVSFEGMQDSTGAAFRSDKEYKAGDVVGSADIPDYSAENGFQGWKVSGDTSDTVYSTSQIAAMSINGNTTFTAVFSK